MCRGTVGVALTDVSLRWQSSLSLLHTPNSSDLQMSADVELWPSEQSDSIKATGKYPVTPQGQRREGIALDQCDTAQS